MKSFHELRKELGEYGITPAMMKKAGIENPLQGKKYPYNEMSAKAHYKKYQSKFRVPPIDKKRYPNKEKQGLEGPYRSKKSGKVFYYDKKAGKYYDTDSDMYLSVNDVMESVEMDERFGGDTDIPANPKTKKYIESGKGIILDVQSSLHPTSRFAIYKNPAKGSGQDKVLMATISNPKRGKVKMFAFHGSHVSHQKAMQFAKNHKLVSTKDAKGNPLFAKESVELDERRRQDVYAIVDKNGKVVSSKLTKKNAHKEIAKYRYASDATIVLDPDAKDGDILKAFAKKKNKKSDPELDLRRQRSGAYVSKRESVELDEADNTAAIAKQVKQAVKKYVTGTPKVQSKGGKVRFIMLRADKIDNKLRKMILDIEHPNAKVKNMDDIHYANISDRIISAGADVWMDALGLKESTELDECWDTHVQRGTKMKGGKLVPNCVPKDSVKEGSLGYKKALRSRKKNPDKEKKMDLRRWSAEKKKRNQKIHSDVQSEDIANTAGSGAVAGLGDEPPVSKAAQKKKQRGVTGDIARRKSIPAPKKGDLIPPVLGEEKETFAGCRVFEVEDEEYGKALYGRQKYERWNKKFDMSNETNQMIQTYANRNPGKGIVVKNKKTGDMSYLMNRKY